MKKSALTGFVFCITVISSVIVNAIPRLDLTAVPGGYQATMTISPAVVETVAVSSVTREGRKIEQSFTRFTIEGFSSGSAAAGSPQLLESSFKLAIEDTVLPPSVIFSEETGVQLPAPLYPVQPDFIFSTQNFNPFFSYDTVAYARSSQELSFVTLSDPFFIRGQKGVSVIIKPILYDPRNSQVRIAQRLNIFIPTRQVTVVASDSSAHYDRYLRTVFRNLDSTCIPVVPGQPFKQREKYLILCADRFRAAPSIRLLMDLKAQTFAVTVKTISDIGGHDIVQINQYLKKTRPTYVLFVGNSADFYYYPGCESIDPHLNFTYLSYQNYGTSDPHPDFHLGLMFVNTAQELANAVYKTIAAQTKLDQMGKRYLLLSGYNMSRSTSPELVDTILEHYYSEYLTAMEGVEPFKLFQSRQPVRDMAAAVTLLNRGLWFVNYFGIGLASGWSFRQEPARQSWFSVRNYWHDGINEWGQIQNTVYPFVLSCASSTGDFRYEYGPCWAQTWLTDERLACAVIAPQEHCGLNAAAFNRGFLKQLQKRQFTQIGALMDYAKEYTFDSLDYRQAATTSQLFHLFGDPSLETVPSDSSEFGTFSDRLISGSSVNVRFHNNAVAVYSPYEDFYTITFLRFDGSKILEEFMFCPAGKKVLHLPIRAFDKGLYRLCLTGNQLNTEKKQWVVIQ
ncbi:MAG: hypothetical protein JW795_10205 [Chitinivibrionales bacterium]|nr:hypothetical protein [Chitinivibrionales bacterium]